MGRDEAMKCSKASRTLKVGRLKGYMVSNDFKSLTRILESLQKLLEGNLPC